MNTAQPTMLVMDSASAVDWLTGSEMRVHVMVPAASNSNKLIILALRDDGISSDITMDARNNIPNIDAVTSSMIIG